MADQGMRADASQPDVAGELSSEEILRRLVTWAPKPEERRQLIIDAEVLDFAPHQLERLGVALTGFIGDYTDRGVNDPADRVAIGAAIRKYVATMGVDEVFSYASRLLEASPDTPVPLEIELEVTKMVVRKLMANPAERDEAFPDLADRLLELTRTYLNPRLLVRESYGAIALNAILGLVLLGSRHIVEVRRLLAELDVIWFKQTLARRVERVHRELNEMRPRVSIDGMMDRLHELESQLI